MTVRMIDLTTGKETVREYTAQEIASFVIPSVQIPQTVSRFQAKAALFNAGLLEAVTSLMEHPDTPVLAKLAWAEAQEFKRNSPTTLAMAQALSLTEEQLDNLFINAAGIDA